MGSRIRTFLDSACTIGTTGAVTGLPGTFASALPSPRSSRVSFKSEYTKHQKTKKIDKKADEKRSTYNKEKQITNINKCPRNKKKKKKKKKKKNPGEKKKKKKKKKKS